ncbi:MAG: DUF3787 domain-containing protein [Oscillospiraceae bacterium]
MKKGNKKLKTDEEIVVASAYITQPISQADSRQADTNVAIPNVQNVKRNKKWVEENEK